MSKAPAQIFPLAGTAPTEVGRNSTVRVETLGTAGRFSTATIGSMWGRVIIAAVVVVLVAVWLVALWFVLIGIPTPFFK